MAVKTILGSAKIALFAFIAIFVALSFDQNLASLEVLSFTGFVIVFFVVLMEMILSKL